MFRRHTFFLLALLVAALPALAKPNFSGAWALVADKSDFGPMPVPQKYESTINHADPEVKAKIVQSGQQGEYEVGLTYSTDGKETTNQLRGNPMKCTAKWDGDTLLIESKLDFQGNAVTIVDKWTLSEDGKTFTIDRKLNTPQGDLDQKIVLSKQ